MPNIGSQYHRKNNAEKCVLLVLVNQQNTQIKHCVLSCNTLLTDYYVIKPFTF